MSHRFCPIADGEKQRPSFWEEAAEALAATDAEDPTIVGHDPLDKFTDRELRDRDIGFEMSAHDS